MKIKHNYKMVELRHICPTVYDFIELLDKKINLKENLNLKNEIIFKTFEDFFEYCIITDGNINFETFRKSISNFFDFKHGFKTSVDSFIERGFNEIEAKDKMHSLRIKYVNNCKEKRENIFNNNKEYSFGKIKFTSNEEPTCNLCGSKLEFKLLGNGIKKIISCTNNNCEAASKKTTNAKLKGLVPHELYEKAIKYRKEHSILNVSYWVDKGYSENESKEKIKEIQKKRCSYVNPSNRNTISKTDAIKKYGNEGANIYFRERSRLCVEYWLKRGYDEQIAKENISKLQLENTKHVKNHGVAKRIEYWTDKGYSIEEAKEKLSNSQETFSKEICIKKCGKIKGIERWKERQKKWQKTLHCSKNLHVGYSKISQDLFDILYKTLNKEYIFYGSLNHEYCIRYNDTNYIYDFTDLENRKIIEFQGDIYHGNPILFQENECPNPFKKDKTCKELWEFDKEKSDVAKKHDFEILHVWEYDYRNHKNEVINKCLCFLKNERI